MMHMRVAVLALTLIGVAYGQDKKTEDKKPDEKPAVKLKGSLPTYYKRLGLRDDQVQKILKIRAETKAKTDELTAKIKKLRDDGNEQVEKVLTPEQMKRLREIKLGDKPSDK
jgi:hypothetical protein